MPVDVIVKSLVAGVLASLACGLGALPLAFDGLDPKRHTGLGYSLAGGLMFSASVYNLILPGLTLGSHDVQNLNVYPVVLGILSGAVFMWLSDRFISENHGHESTMAKWGGRTGVLIFLAMSIHSIPEGVAVGVGYASETVYEGSLGTYIALAIGIHNIPEGLAVAIPLRTAGASISRCFWAAFLTSLPQPIAAVPAGIASWLLELIPVSLETDRPVRIAWAFTIGFCMMLLVQVLL